MGGGKEIMRVVDFDGVKYQEKSQTHPSAHGLRMCGYLVIWAECGFHNLDYSFMQVLTIRSVNHHFFYIMYFRVSRLRIELPKTQK